jgi:dTDP-glucose 4,6-dehydratase
VVGGRAEKTNINTVKTICAICDELFPHKAPHEQLITYIADRSGHDRGYANDPNKIDRKLQ